MRRAVSRPEDDALPRYTLRFERDAAPIREETFRAATRAAALQSAQVRLGTARSGEILILIEEGIETARLGPRTQS